MTYFPRCYCTKLAIWGFRINWRFQHKSHVINCGHLWNQTAASDLFPLLSAPLLSATKILRPAFFLVYKINFQDFWTLLINGSQLSSLAPQPWSWPFTTGFTTTASWHSHRMRFSFKSTFLLSSQCVSFILPTTQGNAGQGIKGEGSHIIKKKSKRAAASWSLISVPAVPLFG